MFEGLNLEPTDLFNDVFPGSGAVIVAWDVLKLKSEHLQHGRIQRPNVEANRHFVAGWVWARMK